MNHKKLYILLSSLFGLFLVVFWMFFANYTLKKDTYLYIDHDDTIDSIYTKLDKEASLGHYSAFRLLAFLFNYPKHIHHGRYKLSYISPLNLLRNMRNGKQGPVTLTIPILRTTDDLSEFLGKNFEPSAKEFKETFDSEKICREFGETPNTIICLFIPNTYEIYWNTTPKELLSRMQKESEKFWTSSRKQQASEAGLTPQQVITIASIVEQETTNNDEKPMIAGMYINRFRQGMKLQADPTVKFATKQFSLKRISGSILQTDSPYNTYKYVGLPPGPICIPSQASIKAVLNYTHHDYIYMCAKEDFSGTHNFAKTYTEHQANAKRYTDALDKRNIK
jgi:hypothetical protein